MDPKYKVKILTKVNEVETKLKEIIQKGALKMLSPNQVNVESEKLIAEFAKSIPNDFYYKDEIIKGLRVFKTKLFFEYKRTVDLGWEEIKSLTMELLKRKVNTPTDFISVFLDNTKDMDIDSIYDVRKEGTWMSQKGAIRIVDYYKKLKEQSNALAEQVIKENTTKKALSIRSMVELSLRKSYHDDSLKEFKSAGVKLVWVSTHADCSKRCAPWQGRLYSLDGTLGKQDGHSFVPIEKATDVFGTTKRGRIFKNGLFGFNCRHYMIQYTYGSTYPIDYSADEIKKEREITAQQRAMEREIFKLKHKSMLLKDVEPGKSRELKQKAALKTKEYIEFSKENSHAYYPDRINIPESLLKLPS